MKKRIVSLLGLALLTAGAAENSSAQDLGALLRGSGIDPATLGQAEMAMGDDADPAAAREYSEGTKAGMAGDMDTAIAHLSRAVMLAPNFAGAHFNLGCAYARKGQKTKALLALRNAIRIDAGYKAKARAESDYSSLYQDAEFLALVG